MKTLQHQSLSAMSHGAGESSDTEPSSQSGHTLLTVMEESTVAPSNGKRVQMPNPATSRRDSVLMTGDAFKNIRRQSTKWNAPPIAAGRRTSVASCSSQSRERRELLEVVRVVPPTYRLGPRPDEEFCWYKAKETVADMISTFSAELEYDAKSASRQCVTISEMVKNKMKSLGCVRHKIVVVVNMVENRGQVARSASRCLWDDKTDNQFTLAHTNDSVVVLVSGFALYKE